MLHVRNWYGSAMQTERVDGALLDAAESVLVEIGIDGVSLERVAERAGRSRVTLWRQGITKEILITGLLQRLADDFQAAFWPVLTSPGTGRERLSASLTALFEVADRHLDLLAVSDEVFHWATQRCEFPAGSHGFLGPFIGALRLGAEDGSLAHQGRTEEAADVVFNTACWGYVHLRQRHRWARRRARAQIIAVLVNGLAAPLGEQGRD
jgi:AcrR family transcriptional regulator